MTTASRATLRKKRQEANKALVTEEQLKANPKEANNFIIFGGKRGKSNKSIETFIAKDTGNDSDATH